MGFGCQECISTSQAESPPRQEEFPPDETMKITGEIYQVGGGGLSSPEDAAIYLIDFKGHGALVDAGCGHFHDRVMGNIKARGTKPDAIQYLLLTHCHYDHTGGAEDIRKATGCLVVAHEPDASFLEKGDDEVTAARWYGEKMEPLPVDRRLILPREEIPLGDRTLEAVHIPGHSPGSVVYLTESEGRRVLFGQDVHGPLDSSLLSNRDDYLRSLELIISLEADILCEGHYGIYRGKTEIENFVRSFM